MKKLITLLTLFICVTFTSEAKLMCSKGAKNAYSTKHELIYSGNRHSLGKKVSEFLTKLENDDTTWVLFDIVRVSESATIVIYARR